MPSIKGITNIIKVHQLIDTSSTVVHEEESSVLATAETTNSTEDDTGEFCPHCAWVNEPGSFSCDKRAKFMMKKYKMTEAQSRESLISSSAHNCILKPKTPIWKTVSIDSPVVIFYNVYFGNNNPTNLEIIKEQMGQVDDSFAAEKGVTVLYSTIGHPILNETYMQHLCSSGKKDFRCLAMEHAYQGQEEVTLEHLYDFCQDRMAQKKPDIRVIYMHNKGSAKFNEAGTSKNIYNNIWRRISMSGVTSQLCLEPKDDQCDVCGLNFAGIFAGNFWTAKCSYVSKLLAPRKYHTASAQFQNIAKNLTHLGWTFHPTHMGTGRYANEHWVSSHPSVIPCDLDPHRMWWHWRGEGCPTPQSCRPGSKRKWGLHERSPEEFVWAMAPRDKLHRSQINETEPNDKDGHDGVHLDMSLGRSLLKWFHLYDEAPPPSSWVWRYHIDGEKWKEEFERHGKDVVHKLFPALMDASDPFGH